MKNLIFMLALALALPVNAKENSIQSASTIACGHALYAIGPTLILTKRRFKCIYSYNLNSLKYSIIPGFHEIGFRLDIL